MAEITIDTEKLNYFLKSKNKANNEIRYIEERLLWTNAYKTINKDLTCDIKKLQSTPLEHILTELDNLQIACIKNIKNNNLENKFRMAILAISAAKAYIASDNIAEGWSMISRANHETGVIIGIDEAKLIENKKSEKIEIARNAGITKGKRKEPAKQKIIELLNKNKPAEGWKSPSDATKGILEEYLNFLQQNKNIGLAESNAENYIKKVMKENNILIDKTNN